MSAFKQFTTRDVTITPFEADKSFRFTGDPITGSDVGINFFNGRNVDYTDASANLQSGFVVSSSYNSVYNSIKHLYYTNFLSSSRGDNVPTQSVIPGVTREDDRYVGPIEAPRYENYLQSTLTQSRNFLTGSGQSIGVISIPTKLFGENIVPTTFEFTYTGSSGINSGNGFRLIDDGEGNLLKGSTVVGQIFYAHGIAVVTSTNGSINEFAADLRSNPSNLESSSVAFSSSITLYEQQYKCTIRENEFGSSQNPTLITSGSVLSYVDFATGSYFSPYVTTIGLYNSNTELIAIGKLSQPIPISQYTDTTFIVNFDV